MRGRHLPTPPIWDHAIGSQHLTTMQVGDIDNDGFADFSRLTDAELGYLQETTANGSFCSLGLC
jgi:hypothetical protein